MSDICLYDFELDENCYKVRMLLSMLGLPYRKIAVNMIPGREHLGAALLKLNPRGSLPILTDGALVLSEAEAIMIYLARGHDAGRSLLPMEPNRHGAVAMWMQFAIRDLHAAFLAWRLAMFDQPGDEVALGRAARGAFRLMEDHMVAREFDRAAWFVGDTLTLADLALFPAIALSRDLSIEHEAYPALRRWMRRVRGIPGFITMPGIPDYY